MTGIHCPAGLFQYMCRERRGHRITPADSAREPAVAKTKLGTPKRIFRTIGTQLM